MITLQDVQSAFHSIKVSDGTNVLAIDGAGKIGAIVEATDLDIRNLVFADDKVDVSGSEVSLDAATLAALENVVVSGTVELGATTLAALESITVVDGGGSLTVDGTVELGATTLAALENITVSASDLDIRNLVFADDKVDVSGSEVSLDAATLAALETINVVQGAFASLKTTKVSVTTTSAALVGAALSGRKRIEIQNLGSKDVYIKESNTAVADGIKIPKGSAYQGDISDAQAIYIVAAAGTSDVRVAEYAA